MPSCSVTGCPSGRPGADKVQVFKFPTDDVMKKRWLKLVGRKTIWPGAVVCKKHFVPGYIVPPGETTQGRATDLPVLRSDAVPTLFDFGPAKKIQRRARDSNETETDSVTTVKKPKLGNERNHEDHGYCYKTVPATATLDQR